MQSVLLLAAAACLTIADATVTLPLSEPRLAESFHRVAMPKKGIDMLISPGCKQLRDVVGVLPAADLDLARDIMKSVEDPSFPWTTDRHAHYPTTDYEVHSWPWLDQQMTLLLKQHLLPAMANLFEVDETCLFLRDQFIVKYSSNRNEQSGLASHFDESCFSYVMQLNDPREFGGGGTLFDHAQDAIKVPQGDTLLFCGYNYHAGVPVTSGTRYILTGFIDYRADAEDVRPFYGDLPGDLPTAYGAGSRDFPSPHLAINSEKLSQAYGGLENDALLHAIAYSPSPFPYVDLTTLKAQCAGWLENNHVPNERFYAFLQSIIGQTDTDEKKAFGNNGGVRASN